MNIKELNRLTASHSSTAKGAYIEVEMGFRSVPIYDYDYHLDVGKFVLKPGKEGGWMMQIEELTLITEVCTDDTEVAVEIGGEFISIQGFEYKPEFGKIVLTSVEVEVKQ